MRVMRETFEVARCMKCSLRIIAITGALYFGAHCTLRAHAQDADDPQQMEVDVERDEDGALSRVGQELGDLAKTTENALKNELHKDVALGERGASATASPTTAATPTPNDSLEEIEREVDSLESQAGKNAR